MKTSISFCELFYEFYKKSSVDRATNALVINGNSKKMYHDNIFHVCRYPIIMINVKINFFRV